MLFISGLLMGIIPGIILALLGWHETGSLVVAVLFAVGYVWQRYKNYGPVGEFGVLSFFVAALGGLGVYTAISVIASIIH